MRALKLSRVGLASAIAAALVFLYSDWLLATALNPAASPARSLISELSAQTQPHHYVFRFLDICAGALTLCLVPRVWQLTRRVRSKTLRAVLAAGFAFVGIDSIVDALLPTNCAPSIDAHCSYATTHSLLTNLHMVESGVAGACVAVIPLIWWWALRHRSAWAAGLSLAFAAAQLALGAVVLTFQMLHWPYLGITHRIYECSISLWVAGLSAAAVLPARREGRGTALLKPALQRSTQS